MDGTEQNQARWAREKTGATTGVPLGVCNYLILLTSISGHRLYFQAYPIDFVTDSFAIGGTSVEGNRSQGALAQARHDLASERDRLRLLLDVQQALVANLDLPSLFKALASSLRRVTACDFIGLALPDLSSGTLRQHLVDYRDRQGMLSAGMVVPLHGSASGQAFRTRQLVCFDGVQGDWPDPEIYGTPEGERFYQLLLKEGSPLQGIFCLWSIAMR